MQLLYEWFFTLYTLRERMKQRSNIDTLSLRSENSKFTKPKQRSHTVFSQSYVSLRRWWEDIEDFGLLFNAFRWRRGYGGRSSPAPALQLCNRHQGLNFINDKLPHVASGWNHHQHTCEYDVTLNHQKNQNSFVILRSSENFNIESSHSCSLSSKKTQQSIQKDFQISKDSLSL